MTHRAPSRADHSLDYYRLTYADPTGETAVRDLTPGDVSITWPGGFTIWIPEQQAKRLLEFLVWAYRFRQSRRGHTWAQPKKNDPAAPASANGVESHK